MSEVQDLSHNIGSMSIYEKLARIQEEVMNTSFSKSGENKFQKYDYFELEDLLQKIIPLTIKYETTIMFSFTEHSVLKLKDWNPEKGEVSIRVYWSIHYLFKEISVDEHVSYYGKGYCRFKH